MENLHKRTVTMLGKGIMRVRIRKFLSFKFVQNFVEVFLNKLTSFAVFSTTFSSGREQKSSANYVISLLVRKKGEFVALALKRLVGKFLRRRPKLFWHTNKLSSKDNKTLMIS